MDRGPFDEYNVRRAAREANAAAHERVHIRLGNAKVAIFVAIAIYWALTVGSGGQAWVYYAAVAAFVALAVWHERVVRAITREKAAAAFYADGIARIEDRWMRDEPSGDRFRDPNHPYSDDLDLFGPRSVFQLISLCRTPMGEERLAAWLKQPASVTTIRDRQSRVAALRNRLDLRERVAIANAGSRRFLHPAQLTEWAERAPTLARLRLIAAGGTVMFLLALAVVLNGGSGVPLVLVLAINTLLLVWFGKRAEALAEGLSSSTASAGLDLLANVIGEIERERFDDPALAAIVRRLHGDGHATPASRGIARLARISDWADSRHNIVVKLAELPFLATLHITGACEAWRARHGRQFRDWVDAVGEMEALLSLSGYSYEHPSDPFPELVEESRALLDFTDVAHPLIPAATVVANTLAFASPAANGRSQVLLVSGSNMSGKSTLMRTAGVNVVLALAGAPVRAARMRLTSLQVGTCLRHTDSLQEHRSGFYTEALRLRRIADLLGGALPVFFLFDELLSGTNSKDRRIAAEGVIRSMIDGNAIGMVTTHDLALTEIAAIFPGDVRNVHLQDRVEHGKMMFDYKLREGVITHSNALELMRMIGLDV